jgi:hypothetical protein
VRRPIPNARAIVIRQRAAIRTPTAAAASRCCEAAKSNIMSDKVRVPGAAKWMIDGCAEWQRLGLAKPEAVKKATDAYVAAEDILAEWLRVRQRCRHRGRGRRGISHAGRARRSFTH